MALWQAWTDLLQGILQTLSIDWRLGGGVAIIVLTGVLRGALLPLTWWLAYRAAMRQATLARLEPQLKLIREISAKDPHAQMQKTMELYRQHGIKIADGKSFLGACVQMPVFYGFYQALKTAGASAGFLWIRNLARPDLPLAIVAGLATAAMMAVAPHMPENVRLLLILVPAILCFMAALHFSSGIALYWITSNLFGMVQTLALRRVLTARAGASLA